MNKALRYFVRGFIVILISLSLISCKSLNKQEAKEKEVKNTLNKALSWVYAHPANFASGGFNEIAEEIIMFYTLSNETTDPKKRRIYVRQIERRLGLIKSNKEFIVAPHEYTRFLTITSILEKLGLKVPELRNIIENKLISDPLLFPSHITTSIWNSVYLKRLGYNPRNNIQNLLPHSILSSELRQKLLFQHVRGPVDQRYIDMIGITIYDLTHEIFALTDFGELPAPPFILENKGFFSTLFDNSIDWAINTKHLDVLAEALMSVQCLNLGDIQSFDAGVDLLISSQKPDGSFGIVNPIRPNALRHGILFTIMALSKL